MLDDNIKNKYESEKMERLLKNQARLTIKEFMPINAMNMDALIEHLSFDFSVNEGCSLKFEKNMKEVPIYKSNIMEITYRLNAEATRKIGFNRSQFTNFVDVNMETDGKNFFLNISQKYPNLYEIIGSIDNGALVDTINKITNSGKEISYGIGVNAEGGNLKAIVFMFSISNTLYDEDKESINVVETIVVKVAPVAARPVTEPISEYRISYETVRQICFANKVIGGVAILGAIVALGVVLIYCPPLIPEAISAVSISNTLIKTLTN